MGTTEPTVIITIAPAGATAQPIIERPDPWPADRWLMISAVVVVAALAPSPLDFLRTRLHSTALLERR